MTEKKQTETIVRPGNKSAQDVRRFHTGGRLRGERAMCSDTQGAPLLYSYSVELSTLLEPCTLHPAACCR